MSKKKNPITQITINIEKIEISNNQNVTVNLSEVVSKLIDEIETQINQHDTIEAQNTQNTPQTVETDTNTQTQTKTALNENTEDTKPQTPQPLEPIEVDENKLDLIKEAIANPIEALPQPHKLDSKIFKSESDKPLQEFINRLYYQHLPALKNEGIVVNKFNVFMREIKDSEFVIDNKISIVANYKKLMDFYNRKVEPIETKEDVEKEVVVEPIETKEDVEPIDTILNMLKDVDLENIQSFITAIYDFYYTILKENSQSKITKKLVINHILDLFADSIEVPNNIKNNTNKKYQLLFDLIKSKQVREVTEICTPVENIDDDDIEQFGDFEDDSADEVKEVLHQTDEEKVISITNAYADNELTIVETISKLQDIQFPRFNDELNLDLFKNYDTLYECFLKPNRIGGIAQAYLSSDLKTTEQEADTLDLLKIFLMMAFKQNFFKLV